MLGTRTISTPLTLTRTTDPNTGKIITTPTVVDKFTDIDFKPLLKSIIPLSVTVSVDDKKQFSLTEKETEINYIDYCILTEINNIYNQTNTNIHSDDGFKSFIESIHNKPTLKNKGLSTIYNCLKYIVEQYIEFGIYFYNEPTKTIIVEGKSQTQLATPTQNIKINSWADIYISLTSRTAEDEKIINMSAQDKQKIDDYNIYTSYLTTKKFASLEYIANDINDKLGKSLNKEGGFGLQIELNDNNPSLPSGRPYAISWSVSGIDTESKENTILLYDKTIPLSNGNPRLKSLKMPYDTYNNIIADSNSLMQILDSIFAHFRKFNINLAQTMFRFKNQPGYDKGTTYIEIFSIDLIQQALDKWTGNLNFDVVKKDLGDDFLIFDYATKNSIILELQGSTENHDSLFVTFMPLMNEKSLIAFFEIDVDKISNPDQALLHLKTIYRKLFKTDFTDSNVSGGAKEKLKSILNNSSRKLRIKDVNVQDKSTVAANIINENKSLNNDVEFLTALTQFYSIAGTYPAHLLFAGIPITLKTKGLPGLCSFQVFGLRNAGIYDGIYLIETVDHNIDKSSFDSTINARMLKPRIAAPLRVGG